MNKFLYCFVLQMNCGFGHGWEDMCMSESKKEAHRDLCQYVQSGYAGEFRIVNRRVPNPKYVHRKMTDCEFIPGERWWEKGGDKNA